MNIESLNELIKNYPTLSWLKNESNFDIFFFIPDLKDYIESSEQIMLLDGGLLYIDDLELIDADELLNCKITDDWEKYLKQLVQIPKSSDNNYISKQLIIDILEDDDLYHKIKEAYAKCLDNVKILFADETGENKIRYDLDVCKTIDLLKKVSIEDNKNYKEAMDLLTRKEDEKLLEEYSNSGDSLIGQIRVNSELESFILKDIPLEFNNLEKAIYIYIKMCKSLRYAEDFYAVNQEGPLAQKHKKLENIASVSITNNEVSCYEFNTIYAYFLKKLGINYKHFIGYDDKNQFTELLYKYGDSHLYLKFCYDKYIVKADSTTSVLQGDIIQSKLNQPLRGLICENQNENSREEFFKILSKVYNYIAEREPKISQNEPEKIETYEEIISQFINLSDKLKPVDISDKFDILIRKVNSTKMIGMDAYSYLLQLRKILFSDQEQHDNISISIIRNNKDIVSAMSVISLMLSDENGNIITKRYIFRPGEELFPISLENLQESFNNKTMEYITEENPKISGIKM